MDGARLQSLIYRKQAKGATKAGEIYQVFRATSAMNPMASSPIATIPALFGANAAFSTFNNYGTATWYAYLDGTQTQPMDILVGPGGTFFVAAQQHLAPMLAVEAPRMVQVRVPYQPSGAGFIETYGGNTAAQETVVMSGLPASILQGTKGEKSDTNLPDDVRNPWWGILLPAFPGVILDSSHIIQDDLGRRFTISSAEITDLGWRITAMSAQT